jgi:hypothetical protein
MAKMPGFEAMRAQQEVFLKAMAGGLKGPWAMPGATTGTMPEAETDGGDKSAAEELDDIKRQLAELQSKLNRM